VTSTPFALHPRLNLTRLVRDALLPCKRWQVVVVVGGRPRLRRPACDDFNHTSKPAQPSCNSKGSSFIMCGWTCVYTCSQEQIVFRVSLDLCRRCCVLRHLRFWRERETWGWWCLACLLAWAGLLRWRLSRLAAERR
jgi:hypothetical protein